MAFVARVDGKAIRTNRLKKNSTLLCSIRSCGVRKRKVFINVVNLVTNTTDGA